MSTAEEQQAVNDGLDRVFAGIQEFVRSLRNVVCDPNYKVTYDGYDMKVMLTYFERIFRTKYDQVKEIQKRLRHDDMYPNSHYLCDVIRRRRNGVYSLQIQLEDCLHYDHCLFDASPENHHPKSRPPKWVAFMHTAHALVVLEEDFHQLIKSYKHAWAEVYWLQYHDKWQDYDYVRDPNKLAQLKSLLVQLKTSA